MHDYDNMPVLDWKEDKAPQKAKAQILHQEPVILQMPEGFDAVLDSGEFGCGRQAQTGILHDCDGEQVLKRLAEQNQLPSLLLIADACRESGSQVDIDTAQRRIIVHD